MTLDSLKSVPKSVYKPIDKRDAVNRLFFLLDVYKLPLNRLNYNQIRSYAFALAEKNNLNRLKYLDALITAQAVSYSNENEKMRKKFIDSSINSFRENSEETEEVKKFKKGIAKNINKQAIKKLFEQ